jgi:hypothetical protein
LNTDYAYKLVLLCQQCWEAPYRFHNRHTYGLSNAGTSNSGSQHGWVAGVHCKPGRLEPSLRSASMLAQQLLQRSTIVFSCATPLTLGSQQLPMQLMVPLFRQTQLSLLNVRDNQLDSLSDEVGELRGYHGCLGTGPETLLDPDPARVTRPADYHCSDLPSAGWGYCTQSTKLLASLGNLKSQKQLDPTRCGQLNGLPASVCQPA